MRTYEELQAEVTRLNQIPHLDEAGVTVRMITLIALAPPEILILSTASSKVGASDWKVRPCDFKVSL